MKRLFYLAAGAGRRFGENKLLAAVNGKPLYRHGLELLAALAQTREDCALTVVTRYPAIRDAALALGARAADSPESEKGLSHTIRAALDAAGPLAETDFLVFIAADQPYLTARTVSRLLDAAVPGVCCAAVSCGGRLGSPSLFSAVLAPELRALAGDAGGRGVLARHRAQCRLIPVQNARELLDIDTPDALF